MKINAKIRTALGDVAKLKAQKKYKEAADIYRQIISDVENEDQISAGIYYINLGNVQVADGLEEESIASYQQATELLDGQKGDAILQRSYALQNMADILSWKKDPRAKVAATESLNILRAYPYTTAVDLANAVALNFVAHMFIDNYVKEADFLAAWKIVKEAPCEKLVRPFAFDFIINYLLFMKHAHQDDYQIARSEVEKWAMPDLFTEAVALAEDGPDKYEAVVSAFVAKSDYGNWSAI